MHVLPKVPQVSVLRDTTRQIGWWRLGQSNTRACSKRMCEMKQEWLWCKVINTRWLTTYLGLALREFTQSGQRGQVEQWGGSICCLDKGGWESGENKYMDDWTTTTNTLNQQQVSTMDTNSTKQIWNEIAKAKRKEVLGRKFFLAFL